MNTRTEPAAGFCFLFARAKKEVPCAGIQRELDLDFGLSLDFVIDFALNQKFKTEYNRPKTGKSLFSAGVTVPAR